MMRIRTGEHSEESCIFGVAKIGDGEWGVFSMLTQELANTPGVLREWRRFNRSVIEHFLRCNGHDDFETIDYESDEHDPIDFSDGDEFEDE